MACNPESSSSPSPSTCVSSPSSPYRHSLIPLAFILRILRVRSFITPEPTESEKREQRATNYDEWYFVVCHAIFHVQCQRGNDRAVGAGSIKALRRAARWRSRSRAGRRRRRLRIEADHIVPEADSHRRDADCHQHNARCSTAVTSKPL